MEFHVKVLLTNADSRKVFDLFNLLKRKNMEVVLVSKKTNFLLKHAYQQKIYSSVELALERSDAPLCFFPVDEVEILNYYSFYSKLPNVVSILPQKDKFNLVRDKLLLSQYCKKICVDVPDLVANDDVIELRLDEFPLVCKPRIGDGAMGVNFIENPGELAKIKFDSNSFFQKKIVSSKKVLGAFFFMFEGTLIAFYSHERIRTFPYSGGVSLLSKSTNNLIIKEIGYKLLSSLAWSGIAMLEFMYDDASEKYFLIEVNPRLWGSFMLSEYCGANFIDSYCNAAKIVMDDNAHLIEHIYSDEISVGNYIRWVFPWDLYLFLKRKVSFKDFINTSYENICYINWSYSSLFRSLMIHVFYMFDVNVLKKLLKKIKR